jgi:hypothetical protein
VSRRIKVYVQTAVYCRWWAMCTNVATGTMSHPVLLVVPICDRCRDKVEQLGGAR